MEARRGGAAQGIAPPVGDGRRLAAVEPLPFVPTSAESASGKSRYSAALRRHLRIDVSVQLLGRAVTRGGELEGAVELRGSFVKTDLELAETVGTEAELATSEREAVDPLLALEMAEPRAHGGGELEVLVGVLEVDPQVVVLHAALLQTKGGSS
jgi:hypothetical protein